MHAPRRNILGREKFATAGAPSPACKARALLRWKSQRALSIERFVGTRAPPLRDRNFTRFRRRRRRNDPFGFRGAILPAEFFHIKQKEHAGHDQERTDPFQEPAGVAQNLNRALPEILRIPRRLRHLEGLAAPGSPPSARKT